MHPTSSAAPEALRQYSLATRGAGAELDAESRRLQAALAELHRRCTEYPLPETHGLDGRLAGAARGLGELAAWVEGVAAAFRQADAGALAGLAGGLGAAPDGRGSGPSPWPGRAPGGPPAPALTETRPPHPAAAFRLVEASVALLMGRYGQAFAALVFALPEETRAALARVLLFAVAEGTGAAALLRAFAALDAALGQLLPALAWAAESGPDAAALLVMELLWAADPRLPGRGLVHDGPAKARVWNALAATLARLLPVAEARAAQLAGNPALASNLDVVLGGSVLAGGLGLAALSVVGDVHHWAFQPVEGPADAVELGLRSFWNQAFDNVDPRLLLALAARIDALNLRFGQAAEGVDECAVLTSQAPGAYHAISYAPGEQLVLEKLNGAGDYRLSIAGLDPKKPGVPNNFQAVMLAAYFQPADNHYYRHVRARLFEALRDIPPGSRLHLQGHSLGGAMCLMLWNDPEVRRRLRDAGVVVPSLTTYGAVVPAHVRIGPPLPAGDPFADTELRAFVHASDSLALNVGAGYDGFAGVQLIGGPQVEAPEHAHTDYANPEHYHGLPPELLELPYLVDPEHYERTVPPPPEAPTPYVPVEGPPPVPAPFA